MAPGHRIGRKAVWPENAGDEESKRDNDPAFRLQKMGKGRQFAVEKDAAVLVVQFFESLGEKQGITRVLRPDF